jgi:hypothetical protein
MPFKVAATRSSLTGPPPVDTNVYELRVVGFKPKVAKSGTSLNYYGEFEVINNGQFDGRKVFFSLNTAFPTGIRDFVHATGNEMEKTTILNEETGQMEEAFVLPGIFENADQFPQEPEKWGAYRGPLTNATFKWHFGPATKGGAILLPCIFGAFMKWQCSYHNSKGVRCENEAIYRAQFHEEHPFDHMDLCETHVPIYHDSASYIEDLKLDWNDANTSQGKS